MAPCPTPAAKAGLGEKPKPPFAYCWPAGPQPLMRERLVALKRRPPESWVAGERLPGGAASSQVAGHGGSQGCFE